MTTLDPSSTEDRSVPLVSVVITAYNRENWLSRAIESALNQRTTFPIEIIVADDCSTDTSLRIALNYQELHPTLIKVLKRTKNVGTQRNTYETFEQCQGKYIAWLDADDYWTDPEKLAIQAGLLESDPSVSSCGHCVRWVTTDGQVDREIFPATLPGRYGLGEIIHHCFLPSVSVMFRNGIQRNMPPWYFELAPCSDWPIHLMAALSGDLVLLDRIMADYMLTPGSALMSKGALYWYKSDAAFYEKIESILPSKWHRLVRSEKGKRYEAMAYLLRKQGDFSGSRRAALKAFCSPSLTDNFGSKTKALLAALVREAEWRVTRATPAA